MTKQTSRPFITIFLAFAFGIILSRYFSPPFPAVVFAGILLLPVLLFLADRPKIFAGVLMIFLTVMGFSYAQARRLPSRDDIANSARYYFGKEIILEGTVVSDPNKVKFRNTVKTTCLLKISRIKTDWGWKRKAGLVLVNIFKDEALRYGDYILLPGKLHEPFNYSNDNNFSYRQYLEYKGIKFIFSVKKANRIDVLAKDKANRLVKKIFEARGYFRNEINRFLTFNEAAIMRAFLLGDRTNIPASINELFVITGTMHVLAISGFNMTMIAALFIFFLKMLPVSRKISFLVAILLLAAYSILAQSSPSVIRSTVMIVIVLSGFILEKNYDPLNNLFFAGFFILMANPFNIFDVGFQLSFICVFAIIVFYPAVNGWLNHIVFKSENSAKRLIIDSISLSLAIWITVLGLIVYYFRIVTPITILANLIVIPIANIVLILGLIFMFFSFANCWLASILSLFIKISLNAMVGAIFILSKVPGAFFRTGEVKIYYLALYYAGIAFGFAFLHFAVKRRLTSSRR